MDLPLLSGGRRLHWQQLPAAVRQGLQTRLGSPVVHAATQPGGFSPGLAARLRLADGRRVSVKTAGPDPNPHTPALHRTEAQITAALPPTTPSPRLLWHRRLAPSPPSQETVKRDPEDQRVSYAMR